MLILTPLSFGLVGTYSNQACHIIILRVTKYAHGDVGVAIDKITNYSNDSKYGVTIKYKITEISCIMDFFCKIFNAQTGNIHY